MFRDIVGYTLITLGGLGVAYTNYVSVDLTQGQSFVHYFWYYILEITSVSFGLLLIRD